jgi:hypothetical protein
MENMEWLQDERFVTQTKLTNLETGEKGNCFVACIASIMGFPIHAVPEFDDTDWAIKYDTWLSAYGKELNHYMNGDIPTGFSIACGYTERNGGTVRHACIARDGVVVFDPHPSRVGLLNNDYYIAIAPLSEPVVYRPNQGEGI